ncbi:homoserine kinase [Erythrobacteraceae bacterium CFH 75059]|uniref:homoserine kinase n=1 Tax=Qipengyuania thermophila TaxID=2509361 RepID=UPI0010203FDF|nr:homoserine kinase [Qipengyuania thermophila]TCD06214.1 homoserine kinase [Erythrobacteraceae bacterium CFH 75059]
MAVYSDYSPAELAALLRPWDVGDLERAQPIAAGVSNSNWHVHTRRGAARTRHVLTVFERRIDPAELPFFLGLVDHLGRGGLPVPAPVPTVSGELWTWHRGKAAALLHFLPGEVIDRPDAAQARSAGRALARIHLRAASFAKGRRQTLGRAAWRRMLDAVGPDRLATLAPDLPALLAEELAFLDRNWPDRLPSGIAHCDLFPDNVLLDGARVTGLLDFYFAATDFYAYDLAIAVLAWCFDERDGAFARPRLEAMIAGYEEHRPLLAAERRAMPVLLRGGCLRFIASRAADWFDADAPSAGGRKDPLAFVRRLHVCRSLDASFFSDPPQGAIAGA